MNQGPDQPRDFMGAADTTSPYERLGITPDASFEAVQAARDSRLADVEDDPLARSRIEAAYDAVLMDRLKERQQGRVSLSARTASQRETAGGGPSSGSQPALPRLPIQGWTPPSIGFPALTLATGRELVFPLVADGLLLTVLLLLPASSPELLLALATGVCVLNLQRRSARFLPAVGWSVLLLLVGALVGGLLLSGMEPSLLRELPLNPLQVQSLPAMILLLLGALFIAL